MVLFLLSAWPNPQFPSWLLANDKLAHAGLYAILGAALGYGAYHDPAKPHPLVAIALGGVYGATDEWHQALVVGRTPGWGDWIADIIGVTVGCFLASYFLGRAALRVAPTGTATTDVPD
jgi:VanZ family protein